jgi:hypothetical protein
VASVLFNAVTLTVWRLNIGNQAAVLEGWRLVEARIAPPPSDAVSIAARGVGPDGATDSGDPYNSRLRLHVTQIDAAQRFAAAFLDEHAKKWRAAEVAAEADGTSVIEFELRLKKSVVLAAFIKGIEQGDPHVAKVELTRSKSKATADE